MSKIALATSTLNSSSLLFDKVSNLLCDLRIVAVDGKSFNRLPKVGVALSKMAFLSWNKSVNVIDHNKMNERCRTNAMVMGRLYDLLTSAQFMMDHRRPYLSALLLSHDSHPVTRALVMIEWRLSKQATDRKMQTISILLKTKPCHDFSHRGSPMISITFPKSKNMYASPKKPVT